MRPVFLSQRQLDARGGLAGLGQEMSPGVTFELTPAEQQTIGRLGDEFDKANSPLSFLEYGTQAGHGPLMTKFDGWLASTGQTELRQVIRMRATPADTVPQQLVHAPVKPKGATPEENWAAFDHPTGEGPWGLDSNGRWRRVPMAPGGKMIGGDYVPPLRPGSPREPTQADVRFTDPKRKAAIVNTLRGDWDQLFYNVAPRGSTSADGVTPGWALLDRGFDYHYEGGNLYPEVSLAESPGDWSQASGIAPKLYNWWLQPPWPRGGGAPGADSGYDAHALGWYRVYVDDQGFRKYKPWSSAELSRLFDRYMLGRHDFVCNAEITRNMASRSAAFQRDQSGRLPQHQSVQSMGYVFPLHQCAESSSKRRRKLIKKAAAVAAVVAGGVFLGPKIATLFKKMQLGKKIGTAFKTVGGAVKGAVTGGSEQKETEAATGASSSTVEQVTRTVVDTANAARTIEAIKNGEVPPPPVSMDGSDFTEWATSIAATYLQSEQQGEINAAEQAELRRQIQLMQQQASQRAQQSPAPVVMYPSTQLSPAVQQVQEQNAAGELDQTKLLTIGVSILGAVLLARSGAI